MKSFSGREDRRELRRVLHLTFNDSLIKNSRFLMIKEKKARRSIETNSSPFSSDLQIEDMKTVTYPSCGDDEDKLFVGGPLIIYPVGPLTPLPIGKTLNKSEENYLKGWIEEIYPMVYAPVGWPPADKPPGVAVVIYRTVWGWPGADAIGYAVKPPIVASWSG